MQTTSAHITESTEVNCVAKWPAYLLLTMRDMGNKPYVTHKVTFKVDSDPRVFDIIPRHGNHQHQGNLLAPVAWCFRITIY